MNSAKKVFAIILFALSAGCLLRTSDAYATDKNVTIGKGSIVSKRITLTRHHGMPNAHKRRVVEIRSRLGR